MHQLGRGGPACLALSIIHQFQGIVLEICPNTTHNGDPLLLALDKTIGPQKCMYVLPFYLSVFTEYVPMYVHMHVYVHIYIYLFISNSIAILRLPKTNGLAKRFFYGKNMSHCSKVNGYL